MHAAGAFPAGVQPFHVRAPAVAYGDAAVAGMGEGSDADLLVGRDTAGILKPLEVGSGELGQGLVGRGDESGAKSLRPDSVHGQVDGLGDQTAGEGPDGRTARQAPPGRRAERRSEGGYGIRALFVRKLGPAEYLLVEDGAFAFAHQSGHQSETIHVRQRRAQSQGASVAGAGILGCPQPPFEQAAAAARGKHDAGGPRGFHAPDCAIEEERFQKRIAAGAIVRDAAVPNRAFPVVLLRFPLIGWHPAVECPVAPSARACGFPDRRSVW